MPGKKIIATKAEAARLDRTASTMAGLKRMTSDLAEKYGEAVRDTNAEWDKILNKYKINHPGKQYTMDRDTREIIEVEK